MHLLCHLSCRKAADLSDVSAAGSQYMFSIMRSSVISSCSAALQKPCNALSFTFSSNLVNVCLCAALYASLYALRTINPVMSAGAALAPELPLY